VNWLRVTPTALHDKRLHVLTLAAQKNPAITWRVFQKYLREDKLAPWKIGWWAWESDFLSLFSQLKLIHWMNIARNKRSRILAHLLQPSGERLSPLIRAIIEVTGPDSPASRILSANFGTGSWSGEHSVREEGRLAEARRWFNDPSPTVRTWAKSEISALERQIPLIRRRETEQDFVYG
jgi:hypothetical protein